MVVAASLVAAEASDAVEELETAVDLEKAVPGLGFPGPVD